MKKHSLGDLQHAIMAVLWDRGEATVAEVHEALRQARGLAPTTVATMLRKMEDKGVVVHHAAGRQYVYRPAVSESMRAAARPASSSLGISGSWRSPRASRQASAIRSR